MPTPVQPSVTELPPPRWMRSVDPSIYTSQQWLELERERVFGRSWWIAAHERDVARPGQYVVVDELEGSILIVRDDAGTVRAFDNSCRHRGSRLLDGAGSVTGIRCPYHGWTYGLDGKTQHIPSAEGVRDHLPPEVGLQTVRSAVWGGFIWVCTNEHTAPLEDCLGGITADLEPYRLSEFEPIQHAVWEIPCNWKAFVENVTDFYHVPYVHKRTIAVHTPEPPDITSFGDHTRQRLDIASYGWRRALDRRCTRGGPYTERQKSALHKYLLFPNTVINALPYHLTVMQAFPLTPNSTRLMYSFCMRRGARGVERARGYATWLASRVILREDIQLLERYQTGLDRGRQQRQVLHELEDAASHFHGTLQRYASSDPEPWAAGPAEQPTTAQSKTA